jgi:hypothetical protein
MCRSSSKCLQYQAHFENKIDITGNGAVVQETFLEIQETQECTVTASQAKACLGFLFKAKNRVQYSEDFPVPQHPPPLLL